eukprot:TRINITY_DN808_c1_g1_i2.p1 TRINITY_DN808_c1_g1~~TRINITY_DN808_c1_g1_i2.p1  ORF type:complete len:346 (+),score=44.22 TRINITY_DN808_c1_g1_i2:99-1136(+)
MSKKEVSPMRQTTNPVISEALAATGVAVVTVPEGTTEYLISSLHDLLVLHSKGKIGDHAAGEMLQKKQSVQNRGSQIRKRRYIHTKLSSMGYPGRLLPALMVFEATASEATLSLCNIDLQIAIGWVLLLCDTNIKSVDDTSNKAPITPEDIAIEYRRLLRLTSQYKEGVGLLEKKRATLPPKISASKPDAVLRQMGSLIAERNNLWKDSYSERCKEAIDLESDSLPADKALVALQPALVTLEKPELIHSIKHCWKSFRTSHNSQFQSMRPLLPPVRREISRKLECRTWFFLFLKSAEPRSLCGPPPDPLQGVDTEIPDSSDCCEAAAAAVQKALGDVPQKYIFHS